MSEIHIAVIGLGYVGLPLAIEFSKKYSVTGFDINADRVGQLRSGSDVTDQIRSEELGTARVLFSSNVEDISSANFYIITVPTPVDPSKKPDLTLLLKASEMVGARLRKDDIVVYESTVYPGCTEEDCVPVLEKASALKFNTDFYCGYSPERVSPGDTIHTLKNIVKITSGSTPEAAAIIDDLYSSIIDAGTFKAGSIKIAEAAKAIENAQRDVNISFVNELSLIFDRMGIDTGDVLDAASTKWNFLKFRPGLVGGHCIGVDPYYLAYKAEELGYHPEVILSGRKVNDHMGVFIVNKVVKLMTGKGLALKHAKALILGFTFKENCPDTRNSRVIDMYNELLQFGISTDIYDPVANNEEVFNNYGLKLIKKLEINCYDVIILAVAHKKFKEIVLGELDLTKKVVFDTKGFFDRQLVDARL